MYHQSSLRAQGAVSALNFPWFNVAEPGARPDPFNRNQALSIL